MKPDQLLPCVLHAASYRSTCPECGQSIAKEDLIGKFGRAASFLCARCTRDRLFSTVIPDDLSETLTDVRDEARLRRLIGLDMGRVCIVRRESDELTWTESPGPDDVITARVRVVDDTIFVTQALRLEPYAVTDD